MVPAGVFHHRTRQALILLLVLLPLACDSDEERQPEPTDPASTPESATGGPERTPEEEAVGGLMRGHFAKAYEARVAIIAADFDAAKAAMRELTRQEGEEGLPEELRPRLVPMREAARKFEDASTLVDAGLALANTLVHCGSCHAVAEKGPRFAVPPIPEGDTPKAHMQRHNWASDRMWEGLVTGAAEPFASAAEVLREDALFDHSDDGYPERIRALSRHVHAVGQSASEAETSEARAEVYGRFLATCAGCHRELGQGPGNQQPAAQ